MVVSTSIHSMRYFGNSILSLSCLAVSAISALPASGQDSADKVNLASEDDLLGANFAKMPPMPKSLRIVHDGSIQYDAGKQTILYQGKVVVTGDNGITLKAEHALINTQSETAIFERASRRQTKVYHPQKAAKSFPASNSLLTRFFSTRQPQPLF